MKKIILTGGGTAGHVTPNIALLPKLINSGYQIQYIGSREGMEKALIEKEGIAYAGISSGKLRRYFDLKNFTDPFRVAKGCFEARKILKNFKPDVVFSKGGFVSVPVAMAAASLKIPVVIHESDISVGLANKIASKFARKICCNFPETLKSFPENKAVLTGSPIREAMFAGSKKQGRRLTGFTEEKPVLLVIGGSLGSVVINNTIRKALEEILKHFQVIHICGKGNISQSRLRTPGYLQYEYVDKELPDLFALADIVVSRAGANTICELLALHKPSLLIPLSGGASRGDQILNAASFEASGYARVLLEEDMTVESLLDAIHKTYEERESLIAKMEESKRERGVEAVLRVIEEVQ